MPQTKANTPTPIFRRKAFWLISTASIMVISAFALPPYLRYKEKEAIAAERVRFSQAEKEVKQAVDGIIAVNGTPAKVQQSKSCSRPSRDAWQDQAPLSCRVYSDLIYQANDEVQANEMLTKIKLSPNSLWIYRNIKNSSNLGDSIQFQKLDLKDYSKLTSYQLILINYTSPQSGMNCSVSNTFYLSSDPSYPDYAGISSPYALAVSIDCGGEATTEHFRKSE